MAAEVEEEVQLDNRFEFDAPMFYDFDEGSPVGAAPPDGWFDTDGPKGLNTPPKPHNEEQHEAKPAAGAVAGAPENANPQQQQQKSDKAGGSKGSEWRRALASISNNTTSAAAGKAAKEQQQGPAGAQQKQRQQQGTKRKAAHECGDDAARDAPAPAASKGRPGSAKQQRRPAARHGEADAATTSTSQAAASRRVPNQLGAAANTQHGQLAHARSPRLHPRARAHASGEHKTSEQLELEQVEREKAEAAALRRRNAQSVKHVLAAPPPPVVHSSRPLTEPAPVELCTSKRRRMHSMETRSMASPYKPTAERIAVFEGRLPGKGRLGSEHSAKVEGSASHTQRAGGHSTLTVPQSPHFATKKRVRPPRFKPREVVEEEEMAAMPKFKARPLNKRILQDRSGQAGVPHVDVKPPTVPEPFAFKTDQRAAEHGGSHGHPPSSSATASGATGRGGVFVFAASGSEGGRVTRSKGATKKAAAGAGWTGQLTQPEPFQLATDVRGAKRSAAAGEHQAEEQRPAKRTRRGASAGPFQLATDVRGAAEEERLEGIRRQQEETARREAEFKALPLNKAALAGAWKPPPAPPPSLTIPDEVSLRTDVRAQRRRAFDEQVTAKQEEREQEQREAAALQAAAEAEEVKELRKRMVHKALPLPDRL